MTLLGKLKSVGRKLGFGAPTSSDPKTQAYINFNRRKWASHAGDKSKGVVLVGLFSWKPSIHCYSYVANHLAAKHGGVVRTFYFQKKNDPRHRQHLRLLRRRARRESRLGDRRRP